MRTGDYRVQFHVRGDVVTVEKIGHRDGFYDEG
jgi:mRNA-degrading endonuclease RelE of RelBE toxin-antitoxin system